MVKSTARETTATTHVITDSRAIWIPPNPGPILGKTSFFQTITTTRPTLSNPATSLMVHPSHLCGICIVYAFHEGLLFTTWFATAVYHSNPLEVLTSLVIIPRFIQILQLLTLTHRIPSGQALVLDTEYTWRQRRLWFKLSKLGQCCFPPSLFRFWLRYLLFLSLCFI